MPKTNLKVYANLPTWDTLSESVKSLINFFMKNASMVFRGDYQGTSFQYMSGNVRNKYYSSFDKTAEHWNSSLELNIPYFEFNPVEEYPVVDGFPDGNSTVSPLTSSLELLELSEDGTSTETDLLSTNPIPVVLTPKSGEVIVNNPRLKPKNIKTNYNHIVQIPIDTEGLNFVSDFQTRTSSFYIDDGEGNIESDVFYKIGVCPFSDNSLEGLVDILKDNLLSMKMGDFLFYKLLDGYTAVGKEYTEDSTYKFSNNIIFPLSVYNEDRDTYSYVGLAYIELCNQDGTLFNQDISDKNIIIYCRPSENESPEEVVIESGLNLTITDQSMEGGFIYTEYRKRETDDITKPLMLLSRQDGSSVGITAGTNGNVRKFSISTDGENWSVYSGVVTLNNGESVYVRANQTITSQDNPTFIMSGIIEAYNNVNSMLRSDFANITDLSTFRTFTFYNLFANCSSLTRSPALPANRLSEHCYDRMFYKCTSLVKAPKLPATVLANYCYYEMFGYCSSLVEPPKLPATTLSPNCYSQMFENCNSLVQAPQLPATNLASACYESMFSGCTSLTQPPSLPVTDLVSGCYIGMFKGCISLVKAPKLPATVLVDNCYRGMFENCTSLIQSPQLPATTLAEACYSSMFYGCTSLAQAPELPATTVPRYCYREMFENCTSLTQAPELPALTLSERCYYRMFYGCSSLTQAPQLPATVLGSYSYYEMFMLCTSLTQAPVISATTLAEYCCYQMFNECTSLAQAYDLPATTLAPNCYSEMFRSTSLVKAPKLPATILAENCYFWMFTGCTQLNEIHIYATDISARYCLNDWLGSVSSTGDFYCVSGVNYREGSTSGIPSGWTRHDIM